MPSNATPPNIQPARFMGIHAVSPELAKKTLASLGADTSFADIHEAFQRLEALLVGDPALDGCMAILRVAANDTGAALDPELHSLVFSPAFMDRLLDGFAMRGGRQGDGDDERVLCPRGFVDVLRAHAVEAGRKADMALFLYDERF
jgi:hypothetical protein